MGLFSRKKKKEEKPKKDQVQELEEVKIQQKKTDTEDTEKTRRTQKNKKIQNTKKNLEDSATARKKDKKKVKKESAKKVSGQAYKNLIRPLVSEKASWLDMNNQYVFEVSPRANKVEIKKAFQEVYNVKPIKVNFIKVKGKKIRRGRDISMTKHWKKAVISLKAGDKIEVYEGV